MNVAIIVATVIAHWLVGGSIALVAVSIIESLLERRHPSIEASNRV